MAQILDPLPHDESGHIVCCYVNATSKIQIARISHIPNWYFERVVFPGQRLLFEAPLRAELEIHTGSIPSAILSNRIPCAKNLQVQSGMEKRRITYPVHSHDGKQCFIQSNWRQ